MKPYFKKILLFYFLTLTIYNVVRAQSTHYSWANSFGGKVYGYEDGRSVAPDSRGNVYMTGAFYTGTLILGNDTLLGHGSSDFYLAKIDSLGTVIWAKAVGGNGYDSGVGISVDANDNILVTGGFSSDSLIFGNDTLYNLGANGASNFFMAKYNSMGQVQWAKSAGGSAPEIGYSITADKNNNVLVIGNYGSQSIIIGNDTLLNSGNGDLFVAKFDSLGNSIWTKSLGGTGHEYGTGIATDKDDNVLISGVYNSSSWNVGSTTLSNSNSEDNMFVAKFDSTGQFLWAKAAGSTYHTRSAGIATDNQNNVIVTGSFGGQSITFGGVTLNGHGGADIYVVKYDDIGNVVWAQSAGSGYADFGSSVTTDINDNLYITGNYDSRDTLKFGSTTLNAFGDIDAFIAKYSPMGNVLWATAFGGIEDDYSSSICTDYKGNVLVTGRFESPNITIGNFTLSNVNSYDIFIAKLVETPTGIQNKFDEHRVVCFPNPFKENCSISISPLPKGASIRILNSSGQELKRLENLSNHPVIFSRKGLPAGVYYIQLFEKDKTLGLGKMIILD